MTTKTEAEDRVRVWEDDCSSIPVHRAPGTIPCEHCLGHLRDRVAAAVLVAHDNALIRRTAVVGACEVFCADPCRETWRALVRDLSLLAWGQHEAVLGDIDPWPEVTEAGMDEAWAIARKAGLLYDREEQDWLPMSSSEPVRTVSLVESEDENGTRSIRAQLLGNGSLQILGKDEGPAVWKLGGGEYLWTWTISRRDVAAAVAAMDGDEGEDPLDVLVRWQPKLGTSDPGNILHRLGVKAFFWSMVDD